MEKPAEQLEFGLSDGGSDALPKPSPSPMELFTEHMALARTIARSFKTTRNTADHDDLEQAALLALHRASEAFRPQEGREFAPYAGQAVRNALNDFFRKTRRIGAREAFSLDAPAEASGSGDVGGEGATWKDNWADAEAEIASLAAAGNESSELLHRAISALLPQQRSIVEAVLAGQTFSEIATERGVTKQAANNTYRRALVQILNELHAMGVQGFESNAGVLHEAPARYQSALLSQPVPTGGFEENLLRSRAEGTVNFATAEAPPTDPALAPASKPSPVMESPVTQVTPEAKGWWARLRAWWRRRR